MNLLAGLTAALGFGAFVWALWPWSLLALGAFAFWLARQRKG